MNGSEQGRRQKIFQGERGNGKRPKNTKKRPKNNTIKPLPGEEGGQRKKRPKNSKKNTEK